MLKEKLGATRRAETEKAPQWLNVYMGPNYYTREPTTIYGGARFDSEQQADRRLAEVLANKRNAAGARIALSECDGILPGTKCIAHEEVTLHFALPVFE